MTIFTAGVCAAVLPATGAFPAADTAVVVLWDGDHLRFVGLRWWGCWYRGHHTSHIQNCAVRCELAGARNSAVVADSHRCVGGDFSVGGAGGGAVISDLAPGDGNIVVPLQVGQYILSRWHVAVDPCWTCFCRVETPWHMI